METKKRLPILIGKEIEREIDSTYWKDISIDLSELGNVFITGYAGSGSVMFLHRIIISLLQLKQSYKNDMKFVLADKELNEFSLYKNLDCVQQPIITDYLAFISALKNADAELDARLQNPNQTHSDYVLIVNRFDYFYEEWRLRNESLKNSYSISQKILEPICKLVRKGSAVNMYVILSSPIPDSTIFSNQLKSVMGNRIVFLSESKFYDERAIKDTFGVNVDTSYTLPHDMLTSFYSFDRIIPIRPLPEQSYAEIEKVVEQFNAQ